VSVTSVRVSTSTHAVTHVTTNVIRSLRQIVRSCGLDVDSMLTVWEALERGTAVWLGSGDLRALVLEVYDPSRPDGDDLVGRFDFTIDYSYDSDADGTLWMDPDTVAFAIRRAGSYASACRYRFVADTRPGRPDVDGWSRTTFRSTDGLTRQSVGTALGGGILGAGITVYRRTS
jgi:hypothetical protein